MPLLPLSVDIIKTAICPIDKVKLDLFDSNCKGLMVEVRISGNKTFYFRYTDSYGRKKQIKLADTREISLKQVRSLVEKYRLKVIFGEDPLLEKKNKRKILTFEEFVYNKYLPHIKGYKKSWNSDESYLKNQILPVLGKLYLDQIEKKDIVELHHELKEKGYKPGTCNRSLILIRYIFNLAIEWETLGVNTNPTNNITLFDDPFGKRERYLSELEAKYLFEVVKSSNNKMMQYIVPMLILTGARKREVLDARWDDIDYENKIWKIPITKNGKPRYVPLSNGVINLLSKVPFKGEYIFANPNTNKPFASIFYSWDEIRKKAGLSDLRIHDLRHSFASFLINNGHSLYEVQRILGHSDIKTTQRYSHLKQETLLNAANTVASIVGY